MSAADAEPDKYPEGWGIPPVCAATVDLATVGLMTSVIASPPGRGRGSFRIPGHVKGPPGWPAGRLITFGVPMESLYGTATVPRRKLLFPSPRARLSCSLLVSGPPSHSSEHRSDPYRADLG